MRKLLILAAALFSIEAHAAKGYLLSCNFEYNADMRRNVYVGVYRGYISGQTYTLFFDRYCPAQI